MSSIRVTTNFKDNFGTDLGDELITKDYLLSVYPGIAQEIGKTPELWVWGSQTYGRLGDSIVAFQSRNSPITTFAGGTNWKQVSAGDSFTAAIKTDGTLWTWGGNSNAQLGINASGDRSTPVTTFAGGNDWKQVGSGSDHVAAIKTDGTLWTWGSNSWNQLGINATGNRSTPVTTFAGGTNWRYVNPNRGSSTMAIKTDGTLWVWGINFSGVLGDNTTIHRSTPVTTFAGGTNWKQVAGSSAIKTDGTLWIWGDNYSTGRLGINSNGYSRTPVTTFAGGTNWKQVSSVSHTAAIKTDGTLWIWGSNGDGQLGDNTNVLKRTPITTFAGGTNWKQVFCGGAHIAAIKTDGTLWIWGDYNWGQLGLSTPGTTDRLTPVTTIIGGTNWKQVSAGSLHMAAIESADFI